MVKRRYLPLALSSIVFVCLLALSSGCTSIFSTTEPEPTPNPITGQSSVAPLVGRGVLVSNQDCADQAQCGSSSKFGQVVLLSSAETRLEAHDLLTGINFGVDILESRDVQVIQPGAANSQWMRFYKVSAKNEQLDCQ